MQLDHYQLSQQHGGEQHQVVGMTPQVLYFNVIAITLVFYTISFYMKNLGLKGI